MTQVTHLAGERGTCRWCREEIVFDGEHWLDKDGTYDGCWLDAFPPTQHHHAPAHA